MSVWTSKKTCVLQVAALLNNSKATQRPSHASVGCDSSTKQSSRKSKKARKQLKKFSGQMPIKEATTTEPIVLDAPPLDSSNIGNRMLMRMGWETGTGLGSALQGQVEPVPVIKRHRRLGLGA